jgi:NodT family efflux transporter outer membrane factor (OMF) lipoprotein
MPIRTASTPSAGKAGKAQTFVATTAESIPADWWHLFHSPQINDLVVMGLQNSPNLAAAYAALRAAQEALNAQIGNSLFPAVDAGLFAQRQRSSGVSIAGVENAPVIFNLFNATVNVSYTLDVFGGARRQIEALCAQVNYQQFQLIAAWLTLTANIVTTAISVASYQAQIEATHALLKAQVGQLRILESQFALGGISRENVLTQETLVNQTRATLPPLEKSLAQSQHALSVLVGHYPSDRMPTPRLDDITLPGKLPVSLPSTLVRQRPDVRAAEALLHAATASIGVATANLFPQFTISGNYGWLASTPSGLFNQLSNTWSIMGTITQPVFHGGALFAARRQAIAVFQQTCAQYRQVVLQAFQNVADTLRALETDARALNAQKRAENSALANLNLTQKQYRLGGASYLSLLNAQQQYQSIRIAVVQAQATRYSDTAALFQALGGGWWHERWCVPQCLQRT